ncbi:ATP-binding protein [Ahrensia sp. R2A130]|uniref:ATP-binding protein n=1 Tax=Ahrensia sp. R2A130 TaxID=744979 RepID=UPI0001E08382|nr:ATP-binding protein [Ahrensia sp. R2A130]EFL91030.1 periplasmic sensor signal transduction histidine kinase [Ahrensia sp. R2A130]
MTTVSEETAGTGQGLEVADGGSSDYARRKRYSLIRRTWRRFARSVGKSMPTGLFGRSLIIIIAPMILLQFVVAFVFMERHWQRTTDRLSAAVVRDISGIVDVIETYPQDADFQTITRIARERFNLTISLLPDTELPPPRPKPFFSILDAALSRQLADQVGKPFWIDTVGDSKLLEIRIRLEEQALRVFVKRNRAYASNTHIFLLWMAGASLVLIGIAIAFLRNQIRPIQKLAEATESFGKGHSISDELRPRGATEVRQATASFLAMRERIERTVEQRTAMLAGVSHDLRTVLTRFRLQLAFLPQTRELEALSGDVDDMQSMLQGYLDFAQGDAGEEAVDTDILEVLSGLSSAADAQNRGYTYFFDGEAIIQVRPVSFGRLVGNLVHNGFRYAKNVEVVGERRARDVVIEVHDDGTGIPKDKYEEVFRPFVRLDEARNLDETGTGLGLSIARDIALLHGGSIELGRSEMLGGLLVTVTLPA